MRIANLLVLMSIVVFILGCDSEDSLEAPVMDSTEVLAKKVQAHIEEGWKQNPELALGQIKSFNLIHKGGQQYRGMLEVEQDGETVTHGVDVTNHDGPGSSDGFEWEMTGRINE